VQAQRKTSHHSKPTLGLVELQLAAAGLLASSTRTGLVAVVLLQEALPQASATLPEHRRYSHLPLVQAQTALIEG
jgi:hypothetical protein